MRRSEEKSMAYCTLAFVDSVSYVGQAKAEEGFRAMAMVGAEYIIPDIYVARLPRLGFAWM
jgi:hypothetical protein